MYPESALFLQHILLASRPAPGGQDGARAFRFEELKSAVSFQTVARGVPVHEKGNRCG
jgi:hypothetical protein